MEDIVDKDLKNIWHPYTQMKDCEQLPPVPISRGEGIRLYDEKGNAYYDTIASWWCNIHGHNHPVIMDAIRAQLEDLDHVLFAGFTHEPAVELADKLVNITPGSLEKVFFSDNGSTSVEAALKISYQFRKNNGEPGRGLFVSLDRGFHGDTFGAMSVSGVDMFNEKFKDLFFTCLKAPAPYCYRCPAGREPGECSMQCLKMAEEIISENKDKITAMILEPLLLGAGGMIVYPDKYLKGIRKITRKYGIHLIADEIATGFGKTGSMFACEKAGIEPDIMCLSKGLTAGVLPAGATMVTEEIYRAFYGQYDEFKTFYHGHTFTANPISCAAANASIELLKKNRSVDNAARINSRLKKFIEKMLRLPIVGDVRSIGVVAAMELVKDKASKKPFSVEDRIGKAVYEEGLELGLILRPLGNIIYLLLPLCTSPEELEDILVRTRKVMERVSSRICGRS